MGNKAEKLVEALAGKGIMKASEILKLGISREYLRKLYAKNVVAKAARGYYVLPGYEMTAMQSITQVAKQIPKGVVCLLSALRVHDLTTQNPFEVWVAIERDTWKPNQTLSTQVRYMRFSGDAFTEGIETKVIDNIKVKVYCPAKTVADCFKYRNKIGLDVALEALREGTRNRLFTMDELWGYAKICRIHQVIRPYLEGMS
ncbi:type IV toxin-antitoxin system AbiEi family antitoxin domain-containing protein [Planctomycetota bacterium]